MTDIPEDLQKDIISKVKAELGLSSDPISVEFVEAMDLLDIQFADGEPDSTEDLTIGDNLAVVERKGDQILSVSFMGISSLLAE